MHTPEMDHNKNLAMMQAFWTNQLERIRTEEIDHKHFAFPLARVKKLMKEDEQVRNKMIGTEVRYCQFIKNHFFI